MARIEAVTVVREVLIAASPETIWRFLVDPAEAVRWMGVSANLDARPGGDYRVEVLPGDVVSGGNPSRSILRTAWSTRGVGSAHPVPCRVARRPSPSTLFPVRKARSCG